jgi:predicted MPP superfamily phosphohydrolase
MTEPSRDSGSSDQVGQFDHPLVDPRSGDVEDDFASPQQKSLIAIAGRLLVEISLPKLLFAWTTTLLLPAILFGLAPLVATTWLANVSAHILALTEIGAALVLAGVLALGWLGWQPLLRMAEDNFWSLTALVVQPAYAFGAEMLRQLTERLFARHWTVLARMRLRATSSAAAGVVICGCAAVLIILIWPHSRWIGTVNDLASPYRLIVPTLANAAILVLGYLAISALIWGFADASMDQPSDLTAFDAPLSGRRSWRIAHVSDLHVVGERYGFRIESGRNGPRGNERLDRVLAHLAGIHAARPVDIVLISGDMTDAGRATEWAEFLDAVARYPTLAARMIVLPGNHDLNIVDRTNPARLDLPFSSGKRLRQMRTLSAIAALQGDRVEVIGNRRTWLLLNEALAQHRTRIARFAERGGLQLSTGLGTIFHDQFPMILPPQDADGLAVAILNSNAESHFSFTNALGYISAEQAHRLAAAIERYPRARWIVALHHHLLEYPRPVALSERVGTALVNGSWFVRKLRPIAARTVVMHGHRHVDWIGACGLLKIISAPSPIMGATNDAPPYVHIHTLAAGSDGRLCLLAPERIEITRSDMS